MFVLKSQLTLKGAIIALSFKDGFAIAIDNSHTFHLLGRKSFSLLQSKKLLDRQKHFPYHRGTVANDGLIHFTMSKSNKSVLLCFDKKIEKKGTFSIHSAYLDTAVFSPNGEYLITGGQDGKIFVFDTKTKNLITSLPQHADYIATVTFSDNSEFIAASSFDFQTVVYDFSRNRQLFTFTTNSVLEVITFYDNNSKLFGIERDGIIVAYDIYEKKEIFKEHFFDDWPSCLAKTEDKKYIIVGTREGFIHGIKLEDHRSVFSAKRRDSGVTYITIDGNNIIVSYADGFVEVLSYNDGFSDVKNALKEQNYSEARRIFDKNVLLNIHPIIKEFDDSWKIVRLKIAELLKDNDIKGIYAIVKPFLDDPKREKEFNEFISQKEEAISFTQAAQRNNYIKAYILAEGNKALKELDLYNKMEELWHRHFLYAKKIIYKNPRAKERTYNLLAVFKDVGIKRPTINLLVQKPEIFKKAEILIARKEYKDFFNLVEQNPPLKEFELYKKVLDYGKNIIKKSKELEKNREYDKAISSLKSILDFKPLNNEVQERLIHLGASINFIKAIESRDLAQIYKLVETHQDFKNFKEFIEMDLIFKKKLQTTMEYAFSGRPGKLAEVLREYLDIHYHKDKIASIYKVAYLNQIKKAVAKKLNVSWRATLLKYISLFGKDNELEHYVTQYKLKKIYLSIDEDGDPQGYEDQKFPDSILVGKK